ncbi:MAG: hypothetical protein AB8E87_12320 [Prochlorococcus sp.]
MTGLIPPPAARAELERLQAYSARFRADTLRVGLDLLGLPVLKRM